MRGWRGLLAMTAAALGCQIGPSVGGFKPATGPAGITVRVATDQPTTMVGELLVAGDTALLVLVDGKVQLAPYGAIRTARFEQRGVLDFGGGRAPRDDRLRQIRQLARFPAGLAPELLQQMLKAHGQAEPKVVP